MGKFFVKLSRKIKQCQNIVSFELVSTDGGPLPQFTAGAHIDILIHHGLIRQYSICNSPSERHRYLICVLRDPESRGGSIAMQDVFEEGDLLQISEPKNHFPLDPYAKRSLLFAGGIGVTPLLCMAEELALRGSDFEFHYCARSGDRIAFRERIAGSAFSSNVKYHLDSGSPDQKLDLADVLSRPDPDTHIYVCGPAGFIEWVTETAAGMGWAADQVHREFFAMQATKMCGERSFEVKIASTGKVYGIPANKSIVTALAENGIEIPMSCEQGVCGTCITRVLEGIPDHRDQFFTEEEHERNDQFMPCCSRSKSSALVLDL